MLTKKDFKALAEIVVELRKVMQSKNADDIDSWAIIYIINSLANMLADYCATQNPNFNRAKFLAACQKSC